MKSRPIDEPFDGPSHMMDGAEPLVYTASEMEKIKAGVRREVVEECKAVVLHHLDNLQNVQLVYEGGFRNLMSVMNAVAEGSSRFIDDGEPLVCTASEVEKIKSEVRKVVVAAVRKSAYEYPSGSELGGYSVDYMIGKDALDAIAEGGEK